MSFLDHPQTVATNNAYFAAMNTHRGFLSYFPTLFAPYRKYIVKGGPGCGKSTLMKKVAQAAENRKLEAIRFYCSSDSDSLDAVVIPSLKLAMLDGTPPHAQEPFCPGAVDSLVNLSAFWNPTLLQPHAKEIQTLSQSISLAYQRVYLLMGAVQKLETAIDLATGEVFDRKRAESILCRLIEKHRIREEKTPTYLTLPATAFGVKGYLHFTSYENQAETVIFVKDRTVYSEHFFTLLKQTLVQNKISYTESLRPLDEKTESVFIPQKAILFTRLAAQKECDGMINLDRMLPERGRGALFSHKALLREMDSLCQSILDMLCHIGKQHDALESYYIAATDYQALNQYSEDLIASLFTAG